MSGMFCWEKPQGDAERLLRFLQPAMRTQPVWTNDYDDYDQHTRDEEGEGSAGGLSFLHDDDDDDAIFHSRVRQ